MPNPNWFAYIALLIWPLVALCLFSRFSVGKATLWTILTAYLLLPVGAEIKFSGVPAFDKISVPNLAALVCCLIFTGRMPRIFRGFGTAELLIIVLLISPFISSLLNSDPIRIGITFLPGVGPYDALSATVAEFIFIIPFFLARQFLRGPDDNTEILRVLVIAGLFYSLPMLFEVRMSPQLHSLVYGYFPSDFVQEVRDGGYRPMVFLGHGLLVAFFAMTTTVAAAALWRTRTPAITYFTPGVITGYLSAVLLLCKTASALSYGLLLVPLVRWASPRSQLLVACVLALVALSYPVLRAAELVPTTSILQTVNAVSAERAGSLQTRFDNEDQLLARAWQRPLFGWGRFGRSRVYNGWDGGDSSTTDGHWIITMGEFGVVGFVAEFGLLGFSVFRAIKALRFARTRREAEYLSALALIVAIGMVDLLPNSSISPWSWLIAGGLLGRAEALQAVTRRGRIPTETMSVAQVPVEERHSALI